MNENLLMIAALFAGILLGFFFFGGLWFTTRKSMASKTAVLWIIGSFIVRTGIILCGFYYVSNGKWNRLLICLLGFIIARILTNRFLSLPNTTIRTEVKNEA